MNRLPFPFSITLPYIRHWQPPCALGFPFTTEINDLWLMGGSGVGSGSNAMKTAVGEYFERRHFYSDIIADTSGTLSHSLTSSEADYFSDALAQTTNAAYEKKQIDNHIFSLTKVIRSADLTECYIPTVCISLNNHTTVEDVPLYPLKDTCGCSFHWNAEHSMFGAIKESLERQFLTRFWLTGHYAECIDSQHIIQLLKKSDMHYLARALHKSGDIVAFDISDPTFPGVCIIMFYGQPDSARHVRYCTGMAYSSTKIKGLEKAIEELWQTFRFMDLFASCEGNINNLKDPYLKHFLMSNTYASYSTITAKTKLTPPTAHSTVRNRTPFNLEGLINSLSTLAVHGYFYIKPTYIENTLSYCCKFISPQLFMHMNNANNINLQNTYSAQFKKHIIIERQKNMVPFP